MSKKITMSSFNHGFGSYKADFQNTKKGIEISNIVDQRKHKSQIKPNDIMLDVLSPFIRPYSGVDLRGVLGKKALSVTLAEDIKAQDEKLEKMKLALWMCKRKNVFFKE